MTKIKRLLITVALLIVSLFANTRESNASKTASADAKSTVSDSSKFRGNTRWVGVYSSIPTETTAVKKIAISKQPDGTLKIRVSLLGLPDEVSEREAIAETYTPITKKSSGNSLIARFSAGKFRPVIIVSTKNASGGTSGGAERTNVSGIIPAIEFTYYMRDVDGSSMRVHGTLKRDVKDK